MKKHNISGIESCSYKNTKRESMENIDGMHVLDARPDEHGEPTDTYMKAAVERLERQDQLVGSAIVGISNVEAA